MSSPTLPGAPAAAAAPVAGHSHNISFPSDSSSPGRGPSSESDIASVVSSEHQQQQQQQQSPHPLSDDPVSSLAPNVSFLRFNQDVTSLAVSTSVGYKLFSLASSVDALECVHAKKMEAENAVRGQGRTIPSL